jgi:hypothetical protein
MRHTCEHCGVVKLSFNSYYRHIRLYHESMQNFYVTCNVNGCKNTFHAVQCLRRHVSKRHREISMNASVSSDETNMECEDVPTDAPMNSVQTETHSVSISLHDRVSQIERHMIQFMLKEKEKYLLPVPVQQDIVNELHLMISEVHEAYQYMFNTFCLENNVAFGSNGSGSVFASEASPFGHIFSEMDSDYKLTKLIESSFQLVKPTELILADSSSGMPAKFSYVSITSTLQFLLSNEDIRNHILSRQMLSQNDRMSSFTDGEVFKDSCFFLFHPNALRLHFYFDEFEVCNPLGSKRGKHKVLAVYFVLGNLDCKYWSEMKFVHLCLLVRYQHLTFYDEHYAKVLHPLVEELQVLASEGFNINTDSVSINFRAAIATVSGDNLSAHCIGGFQRHFNAGRICRFCMANRDEIGQSFIENGFRVQTADIHQYHLEALDSDMANGPVYGVFARCTLLSLPYFDATTAFVPDIMHDLLEGVIPHLLLRVVQKAVKDKLITVELLNARLEQASRHTNDHPNLFTARTLAAGGKIIGSASQKWQLYLLMPQILGHSLPEGDECWECYLLLRNITDYLFAPAIHKSHLTYLEDLTAQFLTQYVLAFGVDALTPKHHYMIHYARLIRLNGSLRPLWCMRFEAKHQYFKSVVSALGNYVNVTKTMANRHQMRQCWEFTASDVLKSEPCPMVKTRVMQMSHLPADLRATIGSKLQIEINLNDTLTITNQLKCDHVTYSVDECMILRTVEEEDIPLYFVVKYIISFRSTWLLCGRLCFCEKFNRHLHAYHVRIDDCWAVIHPSEECDHNGHSFFTLDGCNYASSKYYVSGTGD